MEVKPVDALKRLIRERGAETCSNDQLVGAYLRDLCPGGGKREISALLAAVREGVPKALWEAGTSVPLQLLVGRLAKRLVDDQCLHPEAARYAVEAWAEAMEMGLAKVTPLVSVPWLSGAPVPGRFEVEEEEVSGFLVVKSDAACELFVDESRVAAFAPGKRVKVRLSEGSPE